MDDSKLRAWWWSRQGLDGSMAGKTAKEVLAATGWARSVGGAAPYLGLFARAGVSREDVDAAVAAMDVHELPSARGCTYVLPSTDFALGVKVGQAFWGGDMRAVQKLGVTEAEIDKLCEVVLSVLEKGPLDPDQIKQAAGAAARSLGAEGAKKGTSNTLPVALGKLQAIGGIRRLPVNGRLDQQRYRYARWKPNPLEGFHLTPEKAYTELARRYFRWIGPAKVAEFQWFSGLGAKAANAAIAPLDLVAVGESGRLMFEDDREELERFHTPTEPQYALTSGLDGIALLRRNLVDLVSEEDRERLVMSDSGSKAMGGLADLPSHAILDRGRVVGLWEYDPATESIAWMSFRKPDAAMNKAVSRMEEYVREQLGDARSFSLDSPKSRAPRIEALRKTQSDEAGERENQAM